MQNPISHKYNFFFFILHEITQVSISNSLHSTPASRRSSGPSAVPAFGSSRGRPAQAVKNPPASAGDRVRALVREDPTCRGANKPMRPNYRAWALELESSNY